MHLRIGAPRLPGGVTELRVDEATEEAEVEASDDDDAEDVDEDDEADWCDTDMADEVDELGDTLHGGCELWPTWSLLSGDLASPTLDRLSPLPAGRRALWP